MHSKNLLFFIFSFEFLSSCVTSIDKDRFKDDLAFNKVNISSGSDSSNQSHHEGKFDPISPNIIGKVERFISVLSAPEVKMNLGQEELWSNLPLQYSSGGLIEAAHVLGLFVKSKEVLQNLPSGEERFIKNAEQEQSSMVDDNIYSENNSRTLNSGNEYLIKNENEYSPRFHKLSLFLQKESQARGLDLPFVLLRNSFLQSRGFFYLFRSILSPIREAREDLYLDSLISVVTKNLQLWTDIHKDFTDSNMQTSSQINVQDLKRCDKK
jgi:hypothetical protein